ncbi:hypothetical protein DFQ27_004796 [Actinomortierella ambigua]|uniref:Protein transport protein SFT2 n=1 Tax=Actinomortierella ambigua TaxID=1343610 RepID=A0A9P6U2V3_9FUNG|nr:hypothetical protein DFQ27_004796 [Actinomortierella ambigua]
MANSAESNFRNAFKSFGARGGISVTDNASASSDSGAFSRASDWFGGVRSQVSGYVPVSLGGSSGQQQQQEEDFLGLTWFQRMAGFAICALGGIACFAITAGIFGFFLTIIGSVIQIMALLWYFTSYSPFGTNQIRLGSRMTSLLPV